MPGSARGRERKEQKAEALAISLGTTKPSKKSRTDEQEHEDDESEHGSSSSDDEDEDSDEDEDKQEQSDHSSSSSDNEQGGARAQRSTDQIMEASKDLSAPRTDPKKTDKEKDAAPANRTSYREVLEASARVTRSGTHRQEQKLIARPPSCSPSLLSVIRKETRTTKGSDLLLSN